jgi:hypothetical protein
MEFVTAARWPPCVEYVIILIERIRIVTREKLCKLLKLTNSGRGVDYLGELETTKQLNDAQYDLMAFKFDPRHRSGLRS